MSANNWRVCPRCKRQKDEEQGKVEDMYGKVSAAQYAQLLAESKKSPRLSESLREDWEIGTDTEGNFYVYYGCSCDHCGFSHEFNHKVATQV